jgi:c-di-GMP-binding flagellar brake protein YcgR
MEAMDFHRAERRHPRCHYGAGVEVFINDYAEEVRLDSLNVSRGGMFLRSIYLLDPGERLRVAFRLRPDEPKINAPAKVVWVTAGSMVGSDYASGMGIEFLAVHPDDDKRLARFCDAQVSNVAN